MAIIPIRQFGDPVLRSKAAEVDAIDDSVVQLMADMVETMHVAPGVGLAANQVGVLRRVIVWSNGEDHGAIANPRILESAGEVEDDEGCLSLPGLSYPVVRAQWVRVEGIDESGIPVSREAEDLTARIFQHEIDHLNGVLFIDHLPSDLQRDARQKLRERALNDL